MSNPTIGPQESPLYAGFAGIELPVDQFDLGEGIVFRRSFVHIMAPYLAAVGSGKYGEPWKAVSGGISFDVHAELFVPLDFAPKNWFNRLNTVWWFAALIRAVGNPLARVPVIASHPYADMATMTGEPTFWPVEMDAHSLIVEQHRRLVDPSTLDWIKAHWRAGGALTVENDGFNVAFQAFDESLRHRSYSVGLVTLWGGIERLFSPSHQELAFRVSANIASYLEPAGDSRLELFKAVKKLYGARSKAAHGSGDQDDRIAFVETYKLLKRVLIKMIESRHVPSRDEIEASIFAA